MSFSSDVKEELSKKIDSARHCRIAFLSALFHGVPLLEENRCGIRTENEHVVAAFAAVLREITSAPVSVLKVSASGRLPQIEVSVSGKRPVESFIAAMKLDDGEFGTQDADNESEEGPEIGELEPRWAKVKDLRKVEQNIRTAEMPRILLQKKCCRRAYLRGMFLLCGSVSDPARDYHFEIAPFSAQDAQMVLRLMVSLGFCARLTHRKGRPVVYLKDAGQISDVLGAMGATGSLMKLENARILRDIAGNVNRQVNFETANIKKTVNAAIRQTEDIRYLKKVTGLESLSAPLRQTAALRLRLPDASLSELAMMSTPPASRSCINHRLRHLSAMADTLRADGVVARQKRSGKNNGFNEGRIKKQSH